MSIIQAIEERYKKDIPQFRAGDTLRLKIKVIEGDKERLQPFEGVVIARKGRGANETFTVRKISFGIGVERIFPVYSPSIESIQVMKRGDVRRAKLYYIRDKKGKDAKIKEKAKEVVLIKRVKGQ